jgi:voltage-gated potassium channel
VGDKSGSVPRNNYFLFLGLLAVLVIEPFLAGADKGHALTLLAFTSVLLVGVFSLAEDRRVFRVGATLAVVALVAALGNLRAESLPLEIINLVAIVSFCVLAICVKMRPVVFAPGAVTLDRVVGGLCIYLLLGLLWAMLFGCIELVDPAAFEYADRGLERPRGQLLYYSFVTLTTLGYGDISPIHPVARTLAYLEAVIGQLYIAVLIAGLIGRYIAASRATDDA